MERINKIDIIKDFIKEMAQFGIHTFSKYKICVEVDTNERSVRQAISELGQEDIKHYFMPTGQKGYYRLISKATDDEINNYAHILLKTIKTIYFNKYKPIKNYITDKELEKIMIQLDLALSEGDKNEERL